MALIPTTRKKMMTTRDKWRVYKRVCVMFFLAVVMLMVVQRGVPFQIERQSRMEASSKGGEDRAHQQNKGKPKQAEPTAADTDTTEEPSITQKRAGSRTWDVSSANCNANLNFTNQDWFSGLEKNFKQFLLYRHCRFFPMLMNHPEKCSGETYLLMVIKSIATQHDRREVIRKTWGKEQKLLEYEDYIYRDILQWDFQDSFFNLTLKETHFLKWFSAYCADVRYVFKGDDDVFVSVENIFEYLEASAQVKNLFVGDVLFKAKPIRRKENKYYIPQPLYNKTHYPPYAGGGGFLMDAPLARKLYRASDSLELYPIDDVFLGMCLEVLQVTPINHNAFKTFGLVKNKKSKLNQEPCFFKSMIVVHKLLPPDLMHMWNLVNSNLICSQKMEIL
ncbi:hypothetical protein J4Q44_G00097890 [Coregonus suidteri]|uniref:Hexosyltransferase n=1 Tax=Coregonus suidteri TaxID=861788 RepID=A0AAN8M7E0_9TELE